jgi:transcriptional regulator with XRE-family HTH domain
VRLPHAIDSARQLTCAMIVHYLGGICGFGELMGTNSPLGSFLKDRRGRLDPATLGLGSSRRRTPGLRREEVAQRANVSSTWYTWLEQGRGGRPSIDALNRIADALMLQPAEREHLFILANQLSLQQFYPVQDGISPRIQRVLDTLETSPAYVKDTTTTLVAWNRAAAIVLDDQIETASTGSNLLRYFFCDAKARRRTPEWEREARAAVAAFRLRAARSGPDERIAELVDELCHTSPTFERLWGSKDVVTSGDGNRQFVHPMAGSINYEYSTFGVDGQPHLTMVVYTPATEADLRKIRGLLAGPAAHDQA